MADGLRGQGCEWVKQYVNTGPFGHLHHSYVTATARVKQVPVCVRSIV